MLCLLANKMACPAHTCGLAQRSEPCYILIKSRHIYKPICNDALEMGQGKHMHISVCSMSWHFSQTCTMLLQPLDTKHF